MRGDVFRLRALRQAVGPEQQGHRFAVSLQSDDLQLSTLIVAPTSTSAYPYAFRPHVTIRGIRTVLMLDQIRAVDGQLAIGEPAGRISPEDLAEVDRLLPAVLGLI